MLPFSLLLFLFIFFLFFLRQRYKRHERKNLRDTRYKDLRDTRYKDLRDTRYKDLRDTRYKDLRDTQDTRDTKIARSTACTEKGRAYNVHYRGLFNDFLREAAKKFLFLVARPLRPLDQPPLLTLKKSYFYLSGPPV